jgi:hypothetical protein
LYVPTARIPGFTETVRVDGVTPLPLPMSHDPPLLVVATAVKLTPGVVLLTERLCEAGSEPPCWNPKASVLGATVIVGAAVTFRVTVTVAEPIEDVRVTELLCIPTVSPLGFTDTVTMAGVVPLAGLAESQPPLLAVVEKATAEPVLLCTEKVWGLGTVPPCW